MPMHEDNIILGHPVYATLRDVVCDLDFIGFDRRLGTNFGAMRDAVQHVIRTQAPTRADVTPAFQTDAYRAALRLGGILPLLERDSGVCDHLSHALITGSLDEPPERPEWRV